MRKKTIIVTLSLFILVTGFLMTGCGGGKYAESGMLITSGKEAMALSDEGDWIIMDAQKTTSYEKEHVADAVNVERAQITIKDPVPNTLAPAAVIAEALGKAGLTQDSNVLIYDDNNNMDAGRLAWTLMIYGHKGEIKVVSGGLAAMEREGASIVSGEMEAAASSYSPGPLNPDLIASTEDVLAQVNNPQENVVLLDVRTDEEYNAGTIPGSVHINFTENNFPDGTYRPVQQIRICYKDEGIMPEDTVIMYCKSSIRATQTFAALYNAGYRDLKIYDGAWLEWSANSELPVYKPEVPGQVQVQVEDAS